MCPRAIDPFDPNALELQRQIWLVDSRGLRRRIDSGCADEDDGVEDPTLDRGGLRYLHVLPAPSTALRYSELRTVDSRGRLLSAVPLPDGIWGLAANDKIIVTSRAVGTAYEVAIEPRP